VKDGVSTAWDYMKDTIDHMTHNKDSEKKGLMMESMEPMEPIHDPMRDELLSKEFNKKMNLGDDHLKVPKDEMMKEKDMLPKD
jgi:hypothetical protein